MQKDSGVTLVELLVVLFFIVLLGSFALSGYRTYLVESQRTEAQNRILEIAGRFETFYANTNSYPTGLTGGGTALNLNTAYLVGENYSISLGVAGGGWTISANAINQQAVDDTSCLQINYNNAGQKTPLACW